MVLENHRPHLANRIVPFPLQVYFFLDTCLAENVVTATNSHLESQAVQKIEEIIEPDVGISGPTQ